MARMAILLGAHSKRGRRRRCWMQGGENRRSATTAVADGFGHARCKKRQTKHAGTERDVVPPLPFRYLIPSTPRSTGYGGGVVVCIARDIDPV